MTWGAARGKVHPKRHVCTRDLRRRCRGESSGNQLAMQVRGGKQRLSHLARRAAIHSRNGNEVALWCLWVFRGPFSLISLSLPGCRASRVDLRGSLQNLSIDKLSGTLCVCGSGKHCTVVSRQHLQPRRYVRCMVFARLKSKLQVSTQKGRPNLGNQFFHSVSFAPEAMATEVTTDRP